MLMVREQGNRPNGGQTLTPLQALRIFGPCTLNQLAEHMGRLDVVRLDLELWALESHDQATFSAWRADRPTLWDITKLGRKQFTRDCQRAKDEARLCQGVRAA